MREYIGMPMLSIQGVVKVAADVVGRSREVAVMSDNNAIPFSAHYRNNEPSQ